MVTGSNSTIQSNNRISRIPRYCCPNHHGSTSVFQSWKEAFRIIGFLGHSPNINLAWCSEQHEGWLIWPYYTFPIIRRSGFMIITPSFLPFRIVFSNQKFSNYRSTKDLWSSRRTVFVATGSSRWILSSTVTFAAVILRYSDTILFIVQWPFHLVLVFGHYSFQLMSLHDLCMLS